MADKKSKLLSGRNGSFCVDMVEKDCNKAKVACQWTKASKDGKRKAHCGRRINTKANMSGFAEFNSKKPVQPVFSTKVTIVLEMVDEHFKKISSDLLEDKITYIQDTIIDSVLGMLGLGDSYSYPDMDPRVTDNYVSFEIDIQDPDALTPNERYEAYSRTVASLNREMDEFNDDVEYNNMPRMLIDIEDDSGKKTKYISCGVKAIYLLEL
jgi:hypothetical protein